MAPSGQAPPTFVRMAAHPLRWRLLTELAGRDYRVRELTERVGQPQNLVSYHLRLLRGAGLLTARRSNFDARDSYYHLDLDRCADGLAAAGATLHPALRLGRSPDPIGAAGRVSVLFACTGNSARSPIAEALLRQSGDVGRIDVASAGSQPKPRIHPLAVRVLREEYGVEIADQRPRHLQTLAGRRFDYVITLCDKVREVCPDFGEQPRSIHWSIADPSTGDTEVDAYPAFSGVAAEIDTRVRHLLSELTVTARQEVAP